MFQVLKETQAAKLPSTWVQVDTARLSQWQKRADFRGLGWAFNLYLDHGGTGGHPLSTDLEVASSRGYGTDPGGSALRWPWITTKRHPGCGIQQVMSVESKGRQKLARDSVSWHLSWKGIQSICMKQIVTVIKRLTVASRGINKSKEGSGKKQNTLWVGSSLVVWC